MKVRILSGNATGQVKDLPLVEAQAALDTGFAELVVEEPKAPEPKAAASKPAAAPKEAPAPARVATERRHG